MGKKTDDRTSNSVAGANGVEKIVEKMDEARLRGALIAEASTAYGVDPKFLFASRVEGDTAIILTNGGKRVRYKKGDEVEPLDYIAVTGINPAAKKRKVVAGKKKE